MGLPISKEEYERISAKATAEETSPPSPQRSLSPEALEKLEASYAKLEARWAGKKDLRKVSDDWLCEVYCNFTEGLDDWLESFHAEIDEQLKSILLSRALSIFDDLIRTLAHKKCLLQCGEEEADEGK